MGFALIIHVTTDMHSENGPQRLSRLSLWIFSHLAFSLLCPFLECAEELQEPARQTQVKLRNLEWLSSTSALEAGRSEDAAERTTGLGGRFRFSSPLYDFWQVTEGSEEVSVFHAEHPCIMGKLFLSFPMEPLHAPLFQSKTQLEEQFQLVSLCCNSLVIKELSQGDQIPVLFFLS